MAQKIKNPLVMPVVKWVGGKRQLIKDLRAYMPKGQITKYFEPFFGGGALLFDYQPKCAIVNDVNSDLIGMYKTIGSSVGALIDELKKHPNDEQHFYEIRDLDRDREKYDSLSEVEKAARLIFLNKTCYNGLFRVNNAGEFNTPFGHYANPNIVNEPILRAVSKYLSENNITLNTGDFENALDGVTKCSFVYFDPPYDPVSSSASFTGYSKGGFDRDEQKRLKSVCDTLDASGVKFMVSNSSTPFIHELYSKYNVNVVQAKRAVNSIGTKRGNVNEVIITNYEYSSEK